MADEPTPEQIAEQFRQIDVADLLLSTVTTLGQLAYVKLGANERDQARLAIDGVAALLPALEGKADEQLMRDLKQLLANVRLAFVSSGAGEPEPDVEPEPEPAAEAEPEPGAEPQPAAGAEAEPQPEPEAEPEPGAEPKPEAEPAPQAADETDGGR